VLNQQHIKLLRLDFETNNIEKRKRTTFNSEIELKKK